jgi:hypothetical protein
MWLIVLAHVAQSSHAGCEFTNGLPRDVGYWGRKADIARSVCLSSETKIDSVDLFYILHGNRALTAPAKLAHAAGAAV